MSSSVRSLVMTIRSNQFCNINIKWMLTLFVSLSFSAALRSLSKRKQGYEETSDTNIYTALFIHSIHSYDTFLNIHQALYCSHMLYVGNLESSINLTFVCLNVGRCQSAPREPRQAEKEHANPTKRGMFLFSMPTCYDFVSCV